MSRQLPEALQRTEALEDWAQTIHGALNTLAQETRTLSLTLAKISLKQ